MLGGEWRDVHGGAKGGSLELSLELTPVTPSRRGFHLRDLQRVGILTMFFAGDSRV
jgi:hypothetical protein